jgi:hypothetical protein
MGPLGSGYPPPSMRPPGSYKIASRNRALDAFLDPQVRGARRVRRILQSLRDEIVEGAADGLRIRRVFSSPREIFRLELELPELGYQRTTLLDRDALEELLAAEDVRARVRQRLSNG